MVVVMTVSAEFGLTVSEAKTEGDAGYRHIIQRQSSWKISGLKRDRSTQAVSAENYMWSMFNGLYG